MSQVFRVVMADAHPLLRAGMRTVLANQANINLVGEADSGREVVALCHELRPDVLLLGIDMPGASAVEIVAAVRNSGLATKVLVLTNRDNEPSVRRLVAAGIAGCVLTFEKTELITRAIQMVGQGDTWWSWRIVDKLAQTAPHSAQDGDPVALTEREQQILSLIACGKDNAYIAAQLHLAEQTVRNYVSRLYLSLGVGSRSEAMVWARKYTRGDW